MRSDVIIVTVAPLVVFVLLFTSGLGRPPWTASQVVGLALAIAGVAGLTVARVNLGNSFSVAPEARKLVTTGIYSKIRHPVYVFSAIAIAGGLIFVQMTQYLWVFLVLIPVQILRARREEAVLERAFGDDYRNYRRRTWF